MAANSSPEAAALREMERHVAQLEARGEKRKSLIFQNAVIEAITHKNFHYMRALKLMRHLPVTIDEFIDSKEFLGGRVKIWPALVDDIRRMCPDHLMGNQMPVFECLNGGATGTGKSTIGQVKTLYNIYWLTCFRDVATIFPNLNKYTPLIVMLQSVGERVTKRVLYTPMRTMFLDMPYVQRWVTYDKYKDNTLILNGGQIEVVPAMASVNAYIGQAVIDAILDEVNFMQVIEQSKQVPGPRGQGGHYDQAELVYRELTSRRRSRFITKGPNPGTIYVSSSVHYEGDFLERRMANVLKSNNQDNVIVLKRKRYDVQPEGTYEGPTFRYLVGTRDYPGRVLKDDEIEGRDYPHGARIETPPVELLREFEDDPNGAQRNVLGVASHAINSFIPKTNKIVDMFTRGKDLVPWVRQQDIELDHETLVPPIVLGLLPVDKEVRRFVHVDLSISNDRCGIAVVKVAGYMAIPVPDSDLVETLPFFIVENAITLTPTKQQEIDIAEVRKWIENLKAYYGVSIRCVSYDGFQSKESRQMLRKAGIHSREISLDRTMEPYQVFKDALYQDRIACVRSEIAHVEFSSLEVDEIKGKIDHPPKGSKDLSDAIAGAVYSAATDRLTRADNAVTNASGKRFKRPRPKRKSVAGRRR